MLRTKTVKKKIKKSIYHERTRSTSVEILSPETKSRNLIWDLTETPPSWKVENADVLVKTRSNKILKNNNTKRKTLWDLTQQPSRWIVEDATVLVKRRN